MFRTLKSKISAVYIGLVCLTAAVGSMSVMVSVKLEQSVNGLMTRNYRSISATSDMISSLDRQDDAVIVYVSFDQPKGIDRFFTTQADFLSRYDTAEHNITEPGESAVVTSIGKDYAAFGKSFSELQELRDTKGQNDAINYYNAKIDPLQSKLRGELRQLISINQTAMFRSKDAAAAGAKLSIYILLALTFFAVMVGFLTSGYFVNRFLLPLGKLTEGLSRVRAGDLNLKLDIRTSDETGRLAAEFNEMTKRLALYEQSTLGTLMSEKNRSVAIVKSIADPLIVLDSRFRIILLNTACERFFHVSEKNALGRHFLEIIRNGELYDLLCRSSENGKGRSERIMEFHNDATLFFNVVATQVPDAGSGAIGFILLMQNVTKLKELEQVKTDFFAAVSHEFKTPLTSIIMGASLLHDENIGKLNNEQRDIVRTISEDGERLSDFVSELLEVSKIEAGRSVYHFASCSVNAVVTNSFRQFAETAKRQNVEMIDRLPLALPLVRADFEKITWVMNNLLSNALKNTLPGDTITVDGGVRISDGGGNVLEISVRDTGEGIPAEYLDRIFDKFVQVKGREIEVPGTGLGLSVTKDILAAHGGTIRAQSTPGEGSTFLFTLPLAGPETQGKEMPQ